MNTRTRRILTIVAIVLSLIIVLTTLYGFSLYNKYQETLKKISIIDETEELPKDNEDSPVKSEEPFILLIYGISARMDSNEIGHSDTMMLALVDPQEVSVQLISIPRDSYVEIPGYGMNKINVAYPYGGSKLMIETLESWLSIDISGYVSINFKGFIDLIDLFEGIELEVNRVMRYDDPIDGTSIKLSPGLQVLDGKNALDFVRFRHSNDGRHDSDYDRMERQQQALKALANKLTFMKSLPKLFNIMDILSDNVKTSLSPKRTEELIKTFRNIKPQNIETDSIRGGGHKIDDVWYELIPDDELIRIKELLEEFLNKRPLKG